MLSIWNLTTYCPGARPGSEYTPLMSVVAVRALCMASEVAVTVTPGSGALSADDTRPLTPPYCCPCASTGAALKTIVAMAKYTVLRLMTCDSSREIKQGWRCWGFGVARAWVVPGGSVRVPHASGRAASGACARVAQP